MRQDDGFPSDNVFGHAWYALVEMWRDVQSAWRRLRKWLTRA